MSPGPDGLLARDLMKGGVEAIYDDVVPPIGFMRFVPLQVARGPMFGSAQRMAKAHRGEPVVSEWELYGE